MGALPALAKRAEYFRCCQCLQGQLVEYYRIPKGTQLPVGLAIVRDRFNPRLNATHYTIAPAHDMPLDQFKRLLDQLAILLIREAA